MAENSGRPRAGTSVAMRGIAWMTLSTGAQFLCQLLVIALLARLISPSEFGLVAAANVVIGMLQFVAVGGIGLVVAQRPNMDSVQVRVAFTLSVTTGFVLLVLSQLSASWIARFYGMADVASICQVLALVILIQSIGIVGEQLLARHYDFSTLAKIDVLSYALGYGAVGIAAALSGAGPWSLVAAVLGQSAIRTMAVLGKVRHPMRPSLDRAALRDVGQLACGYLVARLATTVANNADYLVVGRVLGSAALGLYTRSYQLMVMPAVLYGRAVDRVVFPMIAQVAGEKAQVRAAHRLGLELTALIALPTSSFVIVMAKDIVQVIFGEQWLTMTAAVRILGLALYFRVGYLVQTTVHRALGAVRADMGAQAIYALLVLVTSIVGARFGIEGVAVGVTGAIAIHYALYLRSACRLTSLTLAEVIAAHRSPLILTVVVGCAALGGVVALDTLSAPLRLIFIGLGTAVLLLALGRLAPHLAFGAAGVRVFAELRAMTRQATDPAAADRS